MMKTNNIWQLKHWPLKVGYHYFLNSLSLSFETIKQLFLQGLKENFCANFDA